MVPTQFWFGSKVSFVKVWKSTDDLWKNYLKVLFKWPYLKTSFLKWRFKCMGCRERMIITSLIELAAADLGLRNTECINTHPQLKAFSMYRWRQISKALGSMILRQSLKEAGFSSFWIILANHPCVICGVVFCVFGPYLRDRNCGLTSGLKKHNFQKLPENRTKNNTGLFVFYVSWFTFLALLGAKNGFQINMA